MPYNSETSICSSDETPSTVKEEQQDGNQEGKKEGNSQKQSRDRPKLSCLECHAHKRKCDRVRPVCGSCRRSGLADKCEWDPRANRVSRRRRRNSGKKAELIVASLQQASSDGEGETSGGIVQLNNDTRIIPAVVIQHNFTGMARTWFDVCVNRYGEIYHLYGTPIMDVVELVNLYDLWKHYIQSGNTNSLVLRSETREERRALYNTFCALSAFTHACVNSSMVSHARHLLEITADICSQVFACIENREADEATEHMGMACMMLLRATGPTGCSARSTEIVRAGCARVVDWLLIPDTQNWQAIHLLRLAAHLARGEHIHGVVENVQNRRIAVASFDPMTGNAALISDLLNSASFSTFVFGAAVGLYDPMTQLCDFRNARFDSVQSPLNGLFLEHIRTMDELISLASDTAMAQCKWSDFAWMMTLACCYLMCGFSMCWAGNDFPRGLNYLRRGFSHVCSQNITDLFNSPSWGSMLNGARALSMFDPQSFLDILDRTGIMELAMTHEGRLSPRGRELVGMYQEMILEARATVSIMESNPGSQDDGMDGSGGSSFGMNQLFDPQSHETLHDTSPPMDQPGGHYCNQP